MSDIKDNIAVLDTMRKSSNNCSVSNLLRKQQQQKFHSFKLVFREQSSRK